MWNVSRTIGVVFCAGLAGHAGLREAVAQPVTGACCTDTGCVTAPPYPCAQRGGTFRGPGVSCSTDPCTGVDPPEISMSATAARRLLGKGSFVHSIECSYPREVYRADHPMWSLLANGVVVSPMVQFDARNFPTPAAAADGLVAEALACKAAFYGVPSHADLPFYWSVRWAAFGGWYDGNWAGVVPKFSNHPLDCPDADYPAITPRADNYFAGWDVRFLDGANAGTVRTVATWTKDTQILTLTSALSQAPAEGDKLRIEHGSGVWLGHITAVGTTPGTTQFRVYSYPRVLTSHHLIPFTIESRVGTAEPATTIHFVAPDPMWDFFGSYEDDYYTGNAGGGAWAATLKFTSGANSGIECDIIGWKRSARRFTVGVRHLDAGGNPVFDNEGNYVYDPLPAVPQVNDSFTITRGRGDYMSPVFFFKNGAEECAAWTAEFRAALAAIWPSGLPEPRAVVITTEDITAGSVGAVRWDGFASEYERELRDWRAVDSTYTIDGTLTLKDWDALHRKDRNGDTIPLPQNTYGFSPLAEKWHSYLGATLQTAYNYHRYASTWKTLREFWPHTYLTQYQLGNTVGGPKSEVPAQPGEFSYHGTNWYECVMWDEYYGILDIRRTSIPVPGSVSVDVGGGEFIAADDFQPPNNDLVGKHVEFETGSQAGATFAVIDWDPSSRKILLDPAPGSALGSGDHFELIGYNDFVYQDFLDEGAKWNMLFLFMERYGQSCTEDGYYATGKRWAAECAKTQTHAFPENPCSIYYAAGAYGSGYDGQPEFVSGAWTHPAGPGFPLKDGIFNGPDWGEIGGQAMDYGVSHLAWFEPEIVGTPQTGFFPRPEMDEMTVAMDTINLQYIAHVGAYKNLACPTDYNNDGRSTNDDIFAFIAAFVAGDPSADFNASGSVGVDDLSAFLAAFFAGGCP